MNFNFDLQEGLIVVPTRLWGPVGNTIVRLALDTGATMSLVNFDVMVLLGYDPANAIEMVEITTGSGSQLVPKIVLSKLEVLGQERLEFPILCHNLPSTATVDGVLGLDFLRGHRLVIDFRTCLLTLE